MAEEHNAIKYGPQISKAAAIAYGGGYGDVGISRVSETLQVVADLWSRPEWAILRSEILYSRRVAVAGVALLFSSVEIINPAASAVLAVVEFVQLDDITLSGSGQISIDLGTALGAVATTRGIARDSRFSQAGAASQCTVVTGNLAAGATNVQRQLNNTGGEDTEVQGYVLAPGSKLFIISNAAATALAVNLAWRERVPFPGELQARG